MNSNFWTLKKYSTLSIKPVNYYYLFLFPFSESIINFMYTTSVIDNYKELNLEIKEFYISYFRSFAIYLIPVLALLSVEYKSLFKLWSSFSYLYCRTKLRICTKDFTKYAFNFKYDPNYTTIIIKNQDQSI